MKPPILIDTMVLWVLCARCGSPDATAVALMPTKGLSRMPWVRQKFERELLVRHAEYSLTALLDAIGIPYP